MRAPRPLVVADGDGRGLCRCSEVVTRPAPLGRLEVRLVVAAVGTGLRTWCDTTISRPAMIQLQIIDEPPWDMNGVVRPVSGSSRVTPPMIANTCSANANARPAASSLPNGSRHCSAVRRPRATNSP